MSGAEMEEALTMAGLGEVLNQGIGAGYVQRFPNRELALQLEQGDWTKWLVSELGRFRTDLSRGEAKEPSGLRSVALPERVAVEWGFEHWLKQFAAGKLFAQAQVWHEVFASFWQVVPGRLNKWLHEGYSCMVHLHRLKHQPNTHRLEERELSFAQQQAREWVEMGAITEVTWSIPKHYIVCNTVVAYRNGLMDRICWAGGPMNEGVSADKFRMENIAVVSRLLRKGDYMFSLD
jgi:hypothetical protein